MSKSTVLVLTMAICLSGCAHLHTANPFARKNQIIQSKTLKKALKADWQIQRQRPEVRAQEWGACGQRMEPESVCSRLGVVKFRVFSLEHFYSDGGPMDVSKALYCPQENQYWIDETAGSDKLKCRLVGPFSLGGSSPQKRSK